MAFEVLMPKLGLTMTEGTIEEWKKKEGDSVKAGEILYSVATDKLTNDIECEHDGILLKILYGPDETVECKTVIGYIGELGEAVGEQDNTALMEAEEMPEVCEKIETNTILHEGFVRAMPFARKLAKQKGFDLHMIPGSGKDGIVFGKDVLNFNSVGCTGVLVASPYAKKVAKELGVDITKVVGSGPNGRITEKDVRNYKPPIVAVKKIEEPPKPCAAPAEEKGVKASPLAAKVAADLGIDLNQINAHGRVLAEDILAYLKNTREVGAEPEREEVKAMNGMRKAIAKNMLNSHMTSPTVTFNLGIDMTAMKAYRDQLKAKEIKVSYTDLLVKFVAKALTEFPLLNCSVDGNNIIYKNYVNMGVAVALDNGLVVPNITDADKKSLTEISAEVKELASLARAGKLPPEKLQGGTFTITNLGMYGIESFSPIINQPEVAILGVNTMEDKVVVLNGEITIRPVMNLSLTADHRVVDGSVAAQFLQRVKSLMENPALMLA